MRITAVTCALVAAASLSLLSQGTDTFTSALIGTWTGTLEYRDYSNDRRVTLPTILNITAVSGGALEYAYVYDDGPGKTVRSRERISIAADGATYRVQNPDSAYDATFTAEGIATYRGSSSPVVLSGTGTENNQPVDLRITVVLTPSSLTMRRESRPAGGEWRFRNEYRLTKGAGSGE